MWKRSPAVLQCVRALNRRDYATLATELARIRSTGTTEEREAAGYLAGDAALHRGDLARAASAYQEFLKDFPGSRYAPNATRAREAVERLAALPRHPVRKTGIR